MTNTLCWVCGKPFSEDEWEDRHTPEDNPLAECHSHCCDACKKDRQKPQK